MPTTKSRDGMIKVDILEQLVMLEDLSKSNPDEVFTITDSVWYFMPHDHLYDAKKANQTAIRLYRDGPAAYGVPVDKRGAVQQFLSSLDRTHVERGYRLVAEDRITMCAHFAKPKK